jgi:carboxyl-terminal processing protease
MNTRARYFIVMCSTCLVALLLLGGVVTKGADGGSKNDTVYKHLSVYSEVLSRIKTEYVEEPDMSSVTLGALNGLLESIDPYASYLNASHYKEYLKNFDTYKGDLGMVLAKKFGYITIVSVVPGSAADKAGLTTGDFLESIKGVGTRDMPLAYARLLLKGEPGSEADITVLRRKPEPQALKLQRAVITYPAVESKMLPDNVGYIKAASMVEGRAKDVGAAAQALAKQGAQRLVLDLRFCATGDAEEGVALANDFMDKGLITYAVGQKFPRKDFNADPKKAVSNLPLVVLVNRGTAAAAEIAAAALQGNKRAGLVGEHTYGDASILRPISMEDGSAIILSVAKYYSPDAKAIQDNGVTPEQLVADNDNSAANDDDDNDDTPAPRSPTPATVPGPGGAAGAKAGDAVLDKGIEAVKKRS